MIHSTQFRHFLTSAAALGTFLLGWHLIAPEDVAAINKAGTDLVDPLLALLALVAAAVTRVVIGRMMKNFSGNGNDEANGKQDGSSGGSTLSLLLLGTAVGLMGLTLPSCSGSYPVTASGWYRDPATGAKAVLSYSPAHNLQGGITVPVYDAQTGELLGETDVMLGTPVDAAK